MFPFRDPETDTSDYKLLSWRAWENPLTDTSTCTHARTQSLHRSVNCKPSWPIPPSCLRAKPWSDVTLSCSLCLWLNAEPCGRAQGGSYPGGHGTGIWCPQILSCIPIHSAAWTFAVSGSFANHPGHPWPQLASLWTSHNPPYTSPKWEEESRATLDSPKGMVKFKPQEWKLK